MLTYQTDYLEGPHSLLVAVPCLLEPGRVRVYALLDTASEWCLLPATIAVKLGYELEPAPGVPPLHTRFGLLFGQLERIPLVFPADEGTDLEITATFFLCEDWLGPAVIGWRGCLERMRFALNPTEEIFHFAEA